MIGMVAIQALLDKPRRYAHGMAASRNLQRLQIQLAGDSPSPQRIDLSGDFDAQAGVEQSFFFASVVVSPARIRALQICSLTATRSRASWRKR